MKLSFRQGIIRRELGQSRPLLCRHPGDQRGVDLWIEDSPASIVFAHYDENYVVEETRDIEKAWTWPNTVDPDKTIYLYWDIDLATGALSRGYTTSAWIQSSVEPSNPPADLHWWDNVNKRMRVFKKPTPQANGVWQDKIRVFAGYVPPGSAPIHIYPIGSQVGINGGGPYDGGNIILGSNHAPLKQQNGRFVTTATDLIIQQTSGQNVQFDAALIFAEAESEIPAFSLVSFRPFKMVNLAGRYVENDTLVERFAMGLSTQSMAQEEVAQIVTNGVVRNDVWNWAPSQIGAPIFCGLTGQIQLTPPPTGFVQQVGTVYDVDAINLNIFPPVRLR